MALNRREFNYGLVSSLASLPLQRLPSQKQLRVNRQRLMDQRKVRTDADHSFWSYDYDDLGQLKSGKRSWSDTKPVAGQQFEYGFDDIGNRTNTVSGGRSANYTANALNQYTAKENNTVRVVGTADDGATVGVTNAPITGKKDRAWGADFLPRAVMASSRHRRCRSS